MTDCYDLILIFQSYDLAVAPGKIECKLILLRNTDYADLAVAGMPAHQRNQVQAVWVEDLDGVQRQQVVFSEVPLYCFLQSYLKSSWSNELRGLIGGRCHADHIIGVFA